MKKIRLIVTSTFGLEAIVKRELQDLGFHDLLVADRVLLSPWDRETLLIDPMCGSGTILIEAALIARHMAPGINREFAAQHWPSIDAAAWDDARPDKLRKLFNGTIEVNHYQYHAMPDRPSAPLAPAA